MEESFSPLQDLIAKRLVQVNNISEKGTVKLSDTKSDEKISAESEENGSLEKHEQSSIGEPDFVRMEKNIAGFGFFTPSSKRIKNVPKLIKFTQTVDGNRVEAQIKISGNVEYGMPITADQDKYLAFQKIIERSKRENGIIVNPITFTTAELLALLGTSKNGNRYREVEEWLKVMNATFIESEGAVWLNGKKRFASDSFVIFQRVKRTGQELDDGTIADKNYVWLSDWYLENLNAHYLLPIEFETYRQLKNNIAKALIPLLQVWLFASREVGVFEKRYSELCQILNVREYSHKSKIREKLAPSFNELIAHGYLKAWEVEKTADGRDFKIVFRHGQKFYADQLTLKQLSTGNFSRKRKSIENSPVVPPKVESRTNIPKNKKDGKETAYYASGEVTVGKSDAVFTENLPSVMTAEHLEAIRQLHIEHRVSYEKSVRLALNDLAETIKQLEALPFREPEPKNKAGFLIEAIERKYSLPSSYYAHKREQELKEVNSKRQLEIDTCLLCDERGWRNVKNEMDTFYGVMHQCTHDPEIESQFEDHEA